MLENEEDIDLDELTEEEREELLRKYDAESNTRELKGFAKNVIFLSLLICSLFQLYTGLFGEYTAYIQRTVHLGFALTAIFMLYPASKKAQSNELKWFDYGLVIVSALVCGYWPTFYE